MSSPSSLPLSSGLDLTARRDEQIAVARVRAGDALALEVIFKAYWSELLAQAQRVTRDRAVAEEVVQEVFLAIWTGRARWRVTVSLGAYLHRSVHNVAVRMASSRSRGSASDLGIHDAAARAPGLFRDPSPTPDAQAEQTALASAVSSATRDMPPRARDVFVLSREREMSNREIAATLGVSVKTVESHMRRAFMVLRARLGAWRS